MKSEELMVGDYLTFPDVQNDSNCPKLRVIAVNEEDVYVSMDGDPVADLCDPKELAGIPLTPEILEKNFGVVERSSDGYNLVINRELILAFHLKATLDFWIAQLKDWPHLTYSLPLPRYVHELQHALRLCGINKTIKL